MEKKIVRNTISSIIFQITSVFCGFIVPRFILWGYGSDVNGLINSITQFLKVIALMELGVGAVVQTSLYDPLAQKNDIAISKIVASAGKYFKVVATILVFYTIFLAIIYPLIINKQFDYFYIDTLIFAMSISLLTQYMGGLIDSLLLKADQKGYLVYDIQTITLIINTIVCSVLIFLGCNIQIVKIVTAVIYLARPIFLRIHVTKLYKINRNISYTGEPITQKWNGIAQHIAAFILDGTDTIVLTLFSTLSNVSVYSVYNLVVYGVKQLFISGTAGIQSAMGEFWAKNDKEKLNNLFFKSEWLIHNGATFVFGCTGLLIIPFVKVYTKGILDTEYIYYSFAILLTLANAFHCIRLPYNLLILSVGHYKETQHNYIIAAIMNLTISILLVRRFELIGVALGTLAAMIYQTIWMANYDAKKILLHSMKGFWKYLFTDSVTIILAIILASKVSMLDNSYVGFVLMATKILFVMFVSVMLVNIVFYRNIIKEIIVTIKGYL